MLPGTIQSLQRLNNIKPSLVPHHISTFPNSLDLIFFAVEGLAVVTNNDAIVWFVGSAQLVQVVEGGIANGAQDLVEDFGIADTLEEMVDDDAADLMGDGAASN